MGMGGRAARRSIGRKRSRLRFHRWIFRIQSPSSRPSQTQMAAVEGSHGESDTIRPPVVGIYEVRVATSDAQRGFRNRD